MKKTIGRTEAFEIIESEDTIMVRQGSWKHGHTETYVYRDGDIYWMFTARFHPYEGIQDEMFDAIRVEPHRVESVEWRPYQEISEGQIQEAASWGILLTS